MLRRKPSLGAPEITIQRISIIETNYFIYWIEIRSKFSERASNFPGFSLAVWEHIHR